VPYILNIGIRLRGLVHLHIPATLPLERELPLLISRLHKPKSWSGFCGELVLGKNVPRNVFESFFFSWKITTW
jgi:hypothetical protein